MSVLDSIPNGPAVAKRFMARNLASKKLSVALFHETVCDDILFILPFKKGSAFIIPMQFTLTNATDRDSQSAHLNVEVSDHLYQHALPRVMDASPVARSASLVLDKKPGEHIVRLRYGIPALLSGARMTVADLIFAADDTKVPFETRAKTKDEVDVNVKGTFTYAYVLKVTLDGGDVFPWSGQFDLQFRSGHIENFLDIRRQEWHDIKNSGGTRKKWKKTTYIGFTDFSKKGKTIEGVDIFEANPLSIIGYNVKITSRGIEVLWEKLTSVRPECCTGSPPDLTHKANCLSQTSRSLKMYH